MKDKEKIFSLLRESVQSRREANIVEELIDKIERRMAPIETIDDKHKKFNGLTYYKDERTGRYFSRTPLSRVVWTYYNGEIPDGYEIHHVDENKANDDISNLQMMTKSEHWKIHGKDFGKSG
ncbi:MAG: HNH endonuclease, partial [Selenomonadaceae bacterium]|nr:HNH endonuclease [Selenomonadaceae bacterium]